MDLEKISLQAYQWKMSFNPDISKQAQEVIFSKRNVNISHPRPYFNRTPVICCSYQKHSCVYLDKKLSFHQHFKEKSTKASKGIDVIKSMNNVPPRKALLTIYKSLLRPHLDHGDILYLQPQNESISRKLESIQYNATSTITGAIERTLRWKLHNKLGLESLRLRRALRRLFAFKKQYLPVFQFTFHLNAQFNTCLSVQSFN